MYDQKKRLDIKNDQYYNENMKKISATKFKEQCLAIFDRLQGDGVVVTKHGKPVARVLPIEKTNGDLIGKLKDKIEVKGEIFSTGIKWNAQS
jgi:prevent-host-death family protein